MEEKKIDRRIRRTKKLLLKGLTKLMSEKKISNITVKELTDLVDVNRSTFYLYYKDIYDMVEQIETEMFNDFTEAFNRFSRETATYENLISFFTYVFEFVQDNAEMCKILLGQDGDYTFVQKFKQAITESKPLFEDSLSKIKVHFLKPFIVGGCIGIIQQWLADDMAVSPKEMAVIVTELIPYGGK